MKDPDGFYDSITRAAQDWLSEDGVRSELQDEFMKTHRDGLNAMCEKWFEFNEYLTVEIDTDAKTCVVVER
jgi:hypothetical protein